MNPWPDLVTACSFLKFLAGDVLAPDIFAEEQIDVNQVARWLLDQRLGPLAFARCKDKFPELAAILQTDVYQAAAENAMHWHNLDAIISRLDTENIPVTLLKGAALGQTVYGGRERRTMSDVDLWFLEEDFDKASKMMQELGFSLYEKEDRPDALQILADGERQFCRDDWSASLVEFHLSPFPGWWLKRTTAVNNKDIWSRIEPMAGMPGVFQLSPEDTLIHLASHLIVNHQLKLSPIRSLMDITLTILNRPVDWDLLVREAINWRLKHVVWLALYLNQQFFDLPEVAETISRLQPAGWRRQLFDKFVSPEELLSGEDLFSGRMRLVFLLSLVDRVQDMFYLTSRTIWPEQEWLDARYGSDQSRLMHFKQIVQGRGQI